MNKYFQFIALLAVCGGLLLACNEQSSEQTQTESQADASTEGSTSTASQTKDPLTLAEEQAIQTEAESLWYLQQQQKAYQERATTGEVTYAAPTAPAALESAAPSPAAVPITSRMARTLAPVTSRSPGDYSFVPPAGLPVSRPGQLLNLPATNRSRFKVVDRQWPDSTATPSITMWPQDKLAAFSLTIDDNHVQDHDFWLSVADQYGWNWTWFVIVNQIGWSEFDHWGHWQKVLDKGHDVQSHTYSHLCDALFYTYREYRQSKATIEQNLSGTRMLTVAYPFGFNTNKTGSPCVSLNTDRTKNNRLEASRQHIAARDAYGALSAVDKIDYLKVPSISAGNGFFDPNRTWAYFDSILDSNSRNFRTWYVIHYHGLYTEQQKEDVRKILAHLNTRKNDVWVGKFMAVAQYGQQFATARLENIQTASNQLRFELKDEMNDLWFDHPMTIKVRLPSGWNGRTVNVQQAGIPRTAQVVQHAGQAYALLEAIPDRGVVTVNF